MNDLKDKAREYAALKPDWARPGMRCVDPETGAAWRLLAYEAHGWNFDNRRAELLVDGDDPDDMLIRAIAAGPDLDDACTVGGLLMGLERRLHVAGAWSERVRDGYMVSFGDVGRGCGKTLAEATINACIAQAKGEP